MIFALLFVLTSIIIFIILIYKGSLDKHNSALHTICLFLFSSLFGVLVYNYICKETPSTIDVYRGRTKLEITEIIRDSTLVSRDSIVVFK